MDALQNATRNQAAFAEKAAYWYLRLNGFMTVENFILHGHTSSRTDADILGVRFPFRGEPVGSGLEDDSFFQNQPAKRLFVIAEVKCGECKINGPWSNPKKQNMQYVLQAMGDFDPTVVDKVANHLYRNQMYEDEERKIQLLAFGSTKNEDYDSQYPQLQQVPFDKVFGFIYKRFRTYRNQKKDNSQWDEVGRALFELVSQCPTKADFLCRVREASRLGTSSV